MPDSFINMTFPQNGIDRAMGFSSQRGGTTPLGHNVRTFDPRTDRARGAQRSGLTRHIDAKVNGAALIQELMLLVGVGYTPPGGGSVQSSTSGRVVTLVAISGGALYVANAGDTAWTAATNSSGSSPGITSGIPVMSAVNNMQLWIVDGTHMRVYDPATNVLSAWTASAGSLPHDNANYPRLIETWRGRTFLSGISSDPQNWFLTRVSDPTDFDTNPALPSPDQAIFGNNSPLGLIGDVVTCFIPFSDDVAIVGGDHSIYLFNGDPMAGGQIDLVNDGIGMVWGRPWCRGPDGMVYFFSNRMAIFSIAPGQQPSASASRSRPC